MSAALAPLILTLKLDEATFTGFNQLRQQHFPPERNFIPAHITLFHALPGDQEQPIRETLTITCSQVRTLELRFPKPRSLGKGVAIMVESPPLVELRQRLARQWQVWLSPQDRQGYRPHVTIQNKVTPAEAAQLYQHLLETWHPIQGYGEGLLLWRYQGGPWELSDLFSFT